MLMWVTWTAFIATISTKWVSSFAFALWCLSWCASIFVDNCHSVLIIFYWEDLLSIICFYVRLKSKPFTVTPGLLATLNPPWRWAGKSTRRLTSSLPLEGSLQLWVTTKFQVSHTDISLVIIIFVLQCVFPSVYKNDQLFFLIIPGASLGITSDGFFELESLPK